MGKRIIAQRRGRGSPRFRAPTHKRIAPAKYPSLPISKLVRGGVEKLVHDTGRGAPLGLIRLEDGSSFYTTISEGVAVGQEIFIGEGAPVEVGNILPLRDIPEGTLICNLELNPYDGGKLARSSGSYASVITHTPSGTWVGLPSGRRVCLNDECRATIGVVAGAGRIEMPFLKAGEKYHLMRAKGIYYPRVRGVAMIAAAHPHGGHKHKPFTVSRHAPPGAKVGLIAARRTGAKAKRRKVE